MSVGLAEPSTGPPPSARSRRRVTAIRSPRQISRTVIWFSVSVPVLSEQMTVVLPSVSTAGSLRMMARRSAMRETPMASVMVTAAGSPSGIAPTASATAAMNISTPAAPRSMPTTKVTAARARMTYSSSRLNAAILRVSGVSSSRARRCSWEMRPTSVLSPVADDHARRPDRR